MVDVLGILKTIYGLATEIKKLVAKIHENHEECSKLLKLIARVSAIVKWLQQLLLKPTSSSSSSSTTLEGDDHPMSGALMDLKDALNHGQSVVKNCQGKNAPMRALNANDIAAKLRRVWEDVSRNLDVVVFAAVVYHSSVMARMNAHFKDLVNAVRARDASSVSPKLPNLSKQVLDFHPGGGHVPPQVEKSVLTYCSSIQKNVSSQSKDKKTANKTKLDRPSRASLSNGSANNSASMKSVAPQGGPTSIVKKISKVLHVYPLELSFHWDPKKKTMKRAVTVTNTTDSYVAVWIDPPRNEQFTYRRSTMVEPRSTLALSVTMKMHERPRDRSKIEVLMIAVKTKEDVDRLQSASVRGKLTMDSGNMALVNELHGKVYRERLTAITCEPTSCHCQIIPRIRTMETETLLTSVDVHPALAWVVTTNEVGGCVIWDYQKKIKVMELQFKKKAGTGLKQVCSAKFIVHKEWLAVGTGGGFIYIYSYTGTELREVDNFKASADQAINSLAVHPTKPYILSSSDFGRTVMQWYLKDNKWIKTREIDVTTVGVHSLKFNPWDANTFVVVTHVNTARIYTTEFSHHPLTILKGPSSADYYPTDSTQHLMVTCQNASSNCQIQNLETGKVVHTLEVSGRKMKRVACHTTKPILATSNFIENKDRGSTTLEDGTVYLWDANTYSLKQMVQIPGMGSRHYTVFARDKNGLTRLFVMFGKKIAIVEVNL